MFRHLALALLARRSSSQLASAQKKALFDNTRPSRPANADWIIGRHVPVPSPAQSGITGHLARSPTGPAASRRSASRS